MVKVRSYLKLNSDFVQVSDFSGVVPDCSYIEGAIELEVDGIQLLSLETWDYVDQLWAYVVDALLSIVRGLKFSTYMPDQAIELVFEPRGKSLVKVVRRGHGNVEVTTSRHEFVEAVSAAGRLFFARMKELVPQNRAIYEEIESQLRSLGHVVE